MSTDVHFAVKKLRSSPSQPYAVRASRSAPTATEHPFRMEVTEQDGKKGVFFVNDSHDFVEIILMIDDCDVREGKRYSPLLRGYCFPPRFEKTIFLMKNGTPLPFSNKGIVTAYVFDGEGNYKAEMTDIDVPTFVRRKFAKKVSFARTGSTPRVVLSAPYSFSPIHKGRRYPPLRGATISGCGEGLCSCPRSSTDRAGVFYIYAWLGVQIPPRAPLMGWPQVYSAKERFCFKSSTSRLRAAMTA